MQDDHYDRDPRDDRPKSPIKWILLITALLFVAAWTQSWWNPASHAASAWNWNGEKQRADTRYQDVRALSGFDSVTIAGNIRLDLKVGEAESVSFEGNEDTIRAIETRVENNALIISQPRGWYGHHGGTVRAHVTVPSLDRLAVSGSNRVTISGVRKGDSHITVNGSTRVTASGRLDSLQLTINGAGRADLKGMTVDDATVVVNGTGNVSLDVRKNLTATVNGVGNVRYSGAPEHVTSSVNGFGSVKRS